MATNAKFRWDEGDFLSGYARAKSRHFQELKNLVVASSSGKNKLEQHFFLQTAHFKKKHTHTLVHNHLFSYTNSPSTHTHTLMISFRKIARKALKAALKLLLFNSRPVFFFLCQENVSNFPSENIWDGSHGRLHAPDGLPACRWQTLQVTFHVSSDK